MLLSDSGLYTVYHTTLVIITVNVQVDWFCSVWCRFFTIWYWRLWSYNWSKGTSLFVSM